MALLIAWWLSACECPPLTLDQQIEEADIIFLGELSNLSEDVEGCGRTGRWNHSMRVIEVYKGDVVERVNVRSDPPEDGCGIAVEREGEFLVYARRLRNFREYASDRCMGTKPLQEAEPDLALLGAGAPPGDVGCLAVPLGGGVSICAIVALSALLGSLRRRERARIAVRPRP